jgi:hypothetical protein
MSDWTGRRLWVRNRQAQTGIARSMPQVFGEDEDGRYKLKVFVDENLDKCFCPGVHCRFYMSTE